MAKVGLELPPEPPEDVLEICKSQRNAGKVYPGTYSTLLVTGNISLILGGKIPKTLALKYTSNQSDWFIVLENSFSVKTRANW